MLSDVFNIPSSELADVSIYTFAQASSTNRIDTWHRPRGRTMAYILAIGGGGGGGGGLTGATGSARTGGGGGGSGAIVRCIVPMFALPEAMSIFLGYAGAGGPASNPGSNGTGTTIADNTRLGVAATDYILVANGGFGGSAGSGSPATGGAGGTLNTDADCVFSGFAINQYVAGQLGASSGATAGAAGADITALATRLMVTGGAGGGSTPTGNTNFAGGQILNNSSALFPTIPGGTAAGGVGSGGLLRSRPFFSTGGSGGGTNGASGIGGKGGDGAIGSGGGGGGGGVTGGAGGRGGDGLVVIICW